MSPVKQLAVTNSSLSTLARLPGELRNAVYQLAIETEYELEAVFYGPCRLRQSLHLISKQVHKETKGFSQAVKDRPCQHTKFLVTVPQLGEPIPSGTAHNIPPQVMTIRFITGHLVDAPVSVTCYLRLPKSGLDISGGSEEIVERVDHEMTFLTGITTMRVRSVGGGFKAKDVELLAKRLRLAVTGRDL